MANYLGAFWIYTPQGNNMRVMSCSNYSFRVMFKDEAKTFTTATL